MLLYLRAKNFIAFRSTYVALSRSEVDLVASKYFKFIKKYWYQTLLGEAHLRFTSSLYIF